MTVDVEELEFALPNVRMRALAWGPPDGRLALCVHGFPDSADSWRAVAPLLAADGFRVVAPYTRGYAPTSLADDGDYHLGALMSDVLALHRALGAPTDAVLIGHDWGAWTCNAIAALPHSPFSVHVSLALPPVGAVGLSGFSLPRQLKTSAIQCRMSWYIMFFQLPVGPHRVLPRVIRRLWRDWSPRSADVSGDVANALAALPSAAHRKAAVAYYRNIFRFTAAPADYTELHDCRFRLPCRPILYLHGDQDGAMQVAYTENLLDALPAGGRVQIIPGAGHFSQVDQPEAVATAIRQYLADNSAP